MASRRIPPCGETHFPVRKAAPKGWGGREEQGQQKRELLNICPNVVVRMEREVDPVKLLETFYPPADLASPPESSKQIKWNVPGQPFLPYQPAPIVTSLTMS